MPRRRFSRRFNSCLCALLLPGCAASPQGLQAQVETSAVALNPADAAEQTVGRLRFLGGLHLESADKRFGGNSGLYWRGCRLFTVIDDGRWASFIPFEDNDRLTGVRGVEVGELHGTDGEELTGKSAGDAESLTLDANGEWLVGFERDHRVWRYKSLSGAARATMIDPEKLFGGLAPNNGVEALAQSASGLVACVERYSVAQPNCIRLEDEGATEFSVAPPSPLDRLGGTPTDAAMAADGVLYVLFRSYSPEEGPGAAIAARSPDGTTETIAVLRPPLNLDNMEGLAVRQTGERTFFYLISDDNFSPQQRTLLLKFELNADYPAGADK